MRGNGVKKLQETQPRESDIRERRKAMQCSVGSQMHLSDWNLWWQVTGVFGMYWPDPGPKKENQFITLHDNSISALSFFFCEFKNTSPCHFEILGRATGFGMASLSYWCRGSWNGLRCWWLSQIVQEDHSGGRLDWSNMTSDRGYWSDPAPNYPKKNFHIKDLNEKRVYFSDFKYIIKVLFMEEILHHLRSCIKPCNIK